MERSHPGIVLAQLRNQFALLLEDLADLHAEVQALQRELHERQELNTFLLKAVVDDLFSHRGDPTAHLPCRSKRQGRLSSRPCPSCSASSASPHPAPGVATSGRGTA